MRNLPSMLWKTLRGYGDNTAFLATDPDADKDHPISYLDWIKRVQRLAIGLIDHGLQPGARIALITPMNVSSLTFTLSCWLAGGVIVPLDPTAPATHHLRAMARSGCEWIVLSTPQAKQTLTQGRNLPDHLQWFSLGETSQDGMIDFATMMDKGRYRERRGGDTALVKHVFNLPLEAPALVLYDSPLGEDPHGATFSGERIALQLEHLAQDFIQDHAPGVFSASHMEHHSLYPFWLTWTALKHGRQIALPLHGDTPGHHARQHCTDWMMTPDELDAMIQRWQDDAKSQEPAQSSPSLLDLFGAISKTGNPTRLWFERDLGPNIETVWIPGGLPTKDASTVRGLLAKADINLLSIWGLPESGITHMERPGSCKDGSVGRPIYGVSAKVKGAKESAPNGELMIRSDALSLEYWDGSGPRSIDEGWLMTGTLAKQHEGYLFLLPATQDNEQT